MSSSIGLELGAGVSAEHLLHGNAHADNSGVLSSPSAHHAHHTAGVEVHAVRVHTEHDLEEQKEHASPRATPAEGYASADDEDASLKRGSAVRSARAAVLMRELDAMVVSDEIAMNPRHSKKILKYYEDQNALVEAYKDIVRLEEAESASSRDEKEKAEATQNGAVRLAINGSLVLTFVLIVVKFFAAIWSGSIAVLSSAIDSALDVLSQSTLVVSSRFMQRRDPVQYPIGKSRVENLSVLVFSVIMGLAAVFLLYQSVLVLDEGLSNRPDIRIDAVTIAVLAFTIVTQTTAWLYCKAVATRGGEGKQAVEAIAQDHFNDVCCNLIGMAAALMAGFEHSLWFMDPVGGILIAIYIFTRWAMVCHEQFMLLLGQSADNSTTNQLTYLASTFDERIRKVDTVLAYRLGTKLHAEVHIVLPAEMQLREAHDIGEALEQYIERMEDMELAFVHLDFEYAHKGEHNRWKL